MGRKSNHNLLYNNTNRQTISFTCQFLADTIQAKKQSHFRINFVSAYIAGFYVSTFLTSSMQKGGIIIVHDYEGADLPGVKKACEYFLADKPEKVCEVFRGMAKIVKE